jgi:outer membrane protein assembly factor BamB
MTRPIRARLLSIAVACLAAAAPLRPVGMARAADPALRQWAHWRGPEGNGTAPAARPPTVFGPERNLRWKAEIPGQGSSSPVVWLDRVFVTTAVPVAASEAGGSGGAFDFLLIAFDRATGREAWRRVAVRAAPHEGTHETNGFASASPCTDGERVYAHFGSRGLFCFTRAGEPLWQRDFGDMRIRNGFGEGSSPTLAGDLLIVPWDQEQDSRLFAVDRLTGQTVWETPRDEPTCWATPLLATDATGLRQVVMNGQTAARGYDLATGRELWRCGGQTQRPCASAVAADGIAWVTSGFRGSFMAAFDLAARGDLAGTPAVLWTRGADTPDVASPLLSGGRLTFYKEKSGLLTCVEARTGRVHYETRRIPGVSRTYASPIAAGGHVYLTGRSGTIAVIEDAPALAIVATNEIGEGVDATPAAVDGDLVVRGERHLFCFTREGGE